LNTQAITNTALFEWNKPIDNPAVFLFRIQPGWR